jgi:tellurite methyltransferase
VKSLPRNIKPYQRTEEYTDTTVPPGLEIPHNTKAGVWARICVLEGRLLYRILDGPEEEHTLVPGTDGIVEPQIDHQIVVAEPVRFSVEFLRVPS